MSSQRRQTSRSQTSTPALHPAEQYCSDVIAGKIVANKWVRLACQRHRLDLLSGHQRGLYFDPRAASKVINFFPMLRFFEGEWAGRPMILHPSQQFATWSLFGWKRADHSRRFRLAYIEQAKKNGKSTWLAGLGLYMLIGDNEPAAQIYSAAVDKEQAKIIWKAAVEIAKIAPAICNRVQIFTTSIVYGSSSFKPFSKGTRNKQGFNPHFAALDEVHEHSTREVHDLIQASLSSRRQPLEFAITNSGHNRDSICYELHQNALQVLDPDHPFQNDELFALVYGIDTDDKGRIGTEFGGDDPWDEANWIKASPLLGISTRIEALRAEAEGARQKPAAQNVFFRLKLGVWTSQDTAAITAAQWAACKAPEPFSWESMRGQPAFCGVDLSSTQDLTATAWIFPPFQDRTKWRIMSRKWIPQASVDKRKIETPNVPFAQWIEERWVETTPSNLIDYDYVRKAINEWGNAFAPTPFGEDGQMERVVVSDPTRADQLETQLTKDGFLCVNFRQNMSQFAAPTKFFLDLIAAEKLEHNGDPCLTWTALNLQLEEDASGNQRPTKARSKEKIDPMVCAIMACAPAMKFDAKDERSMEILVL